MKVLRRLWPYFRVRWFLVVVSLLLIMLSSSVGNLSPLVIRWVVDRVIVAQQWNWLVLGAALIFALAILQGVLRFQQRYTMEVVTQRAIYELRSDLYQHLQSLSFGFYDKTQTGELMSRVTADVEALRQALGMGFVTGFMNLCVVVGIMILMLVMNWRLALVSLLFLPLLIHAALAFSARTTPLWGLIQKQTAKLSTVIQESISGVRVVRAFAREKEEAAKFRRENEAFQQLNLRVIRQQSFWSQYMNFLTMTGTVAVIWYGGRLAMRKELSIGTLIAFNTYLVMMLNQMRMFGFLISMFTRARAALQRILELLDTKSDVLERPDAIVAPRFAGSVTFENLSFMYHGGTQVLDSINLQVHPGQRIAILGLTGSGKSSLVSLIPRFYDPTHGRVQIDGCDVRTFTLESLRHNIAMVMQENFLFSTTLRENIAYGKPDATMTEIEAVAKAAQIHEFIQSLPDRYETVIGERGVGLSGGQKQRIAIARALLMNAPILIMDESTSAVDVQTEHLIHKAMDLVMQNRTSFIIASRLSTVMKADQVVVLEQGRIVETGTHAELIRTPGLYREIYRLQLKPDEEYSTSQEGVAV